MKPAPKSITAMWEEFGEKMQANGAEPWTDAHRENARVIFWSGAMCAAHILWSVETADEAEKVFDLVEAEIALFKERILLDFVAEKERRAKARAAAEAQTP